MSDWISIWTDLLYNRNPFNFRVSTSSVLFFLDAVCFHGLGNGRFQIRSKYQHKSHCFVLVKNFDSDGTEGCFYSN